jgi:hypothetical protein
MWWKVEPPTRVRWVGKKKLRRSPSKVAGSLIEPDWNPVAAYQTSGAATRAAMPIAAASGTAAVRRRGRVDGTSQ